MSTHRLLMLCTCSCTVHNIYTVLQVKNVQHLWYTYERPRHRMRLLSSCIIHNCGFVNSLRARSFPSEVNPTEREGSQTWILPQLKSPRSQTPLLTSHTFTQRGLHVKISGKGKGRQTHSCAVHWMANAHTHARTVPYPYKHLHTCTQMDPFRAKNTHTVWTDTHSRTDTHWQWSSSVWYLLSSLCSRQISAIVKPAREKHCIR